MNKKWLLPLAIILSLAIGTAGGMFFEPNLFMKWNLPKEDVQKEPVALTDVDLDKVEQAYDLISKHYINKVGHDELVSGAIQGMISRLEDPYSVYMDQETARQFNESLDSSFEGIGTEIGIEEQKVIIVSPYKDSPAEKAGLKTRDEIIAINGETVKGLNVQEVSVKIRGKKGTTVKLEIKRPGVAKHLTFNIKRDQIPIETVFSSIKKESGKKIGYIEITTFSEKTAADFKKQLSELEDQDIHSLIVDVRGNPGGLLPSVAEITNALVASDKPFVQTEDRNGDKTKTYSRLEKKKPYNIVVLTDNGSASASEILAAAMQEAGGYALIGEKTFGKGTVQQVVPMEDGSDIKLTTNKWLTPNGNWIHGVGIEPTIEIAQPALFKTYPLSIEDTLTRDMTNEQVQHAQEMLRGLGYEPGRQDGYFDLKTEIAVKAFQGSSGLKITGKIDELTAVELEKRIIEEIKDEENDVQLRTAIRYLVK